MKDNDRHIKRQLGIDGGVANKHDYRQDTAFCGRRLVRLPDRSLVYADEHGQGPSAAREEEISMNPVMYVPRMDAFLNRWFTTYAEARAALEAEGGFLFPYKNHFFLAPPDAVRELGLDPDDPDWERIGWDWVRPADTQAFKRLQLKRETSLV